MDILLNFVPYPVNIKLITLKSTMGFNFMANVDSPTSQQALDMILSAIGLRESNYKGKDPILASRHRFSEFMAAAQAAFGMALGQTWKIRDGTPQAGKKMIKNLILSSLLCIISFNSWAASKVYTTIGAGLVVPSRNSNTISDSGFVHYGPTASPSGESFFNLPAVNFINNYKNGFNINAAIGYRLFPSIRADIEFLYQGFKRDITGNYGWAEYDASSAIIQNSVSNIQMTPTSSFTNVYSVMTNGYYDFHNSSQWTPLLGAGFGVAWIQSKSTTADGAFTISGSQTPTLQNSQDLSGTAFAWQLKAGLTYDYSKFVAIVIQYRLFATTQFITQPCSIITNPNSGPTVRRIFRVSQQSIRGLFTNALELQLRFDII